MKNFKIAYCALGMLLALTLACSPPKIEGYHTEPVEQKPIGQAEKFNYEIILLTSSGTPLNAAVVSLNTNSFEDSGTTNSDGKTTLVGERLANEPLNFTFKGKNLEASQIIRHLPSTLTDASLVFEVVNEYVVRFSHYSVSGLYR